jgi:HSP20 family molecular chaperone IbpA
MRTEMTRLSAFSSPFLLGFDEVERALDRVAKGSGAGYPPYNIERLAKTGDRPETLRITLAVAGFARDDLEVKVEDRELTIRGRQTEDEGRHYLHRGIAARQFVKTFVLADGIEVTGADLADGLLSIDLARPEGERVTRRIAINGRA